VAKHCIINYAKNGWYPVGQQRLVESLKTVGFDGDVLVFADEKEIGAPSHQESPYAFKPFALKLALDRGYERVLWCDSSVWAIRPVDKLFEQIDQIGHLFFTNAGCGYYCSDACLKSFGISREKSFEITMLMGICMGFDLRVPKTQEFLRQWLEKAVDGVTFPGSWTNKNHEVSDDPRVQGHRHDQSAASLIAFLLDMPLVVPHIDSHFQYFENPTKTTYANNPDLSLMPAHIAMVAQGM
jgi:hypothetical protein